MIDQQIKSLLNRIQTDSKSVFVAVLLLLSTFAHGAESASPYLIGRGISDVTGPSYGVQMWGFGRADQLTEGIHIRQRSRAFIIAQADDPAKRLVFVSADLGSIEHHITLAVIDRLKERYADIYAIHNVIISATHTHAGPGGYWHSRLDNGFDGGFYPEHYAAIVSGVTDSIVQAHEDLQAGEIFLGKDEIANAGANRSMTAYLENPQKERDLYPRNTPTQMTLLKFVNQTRNIGVINWFALHPTAMNYFNPLISGDHKGYASLQMERMRNSEGNGGENFVAAFAQADPGDVTPNTNLDNTGPGETDTLTTQIMGERQLEAALKLMQRANEPLVGAIESRQIYVDLSNYVVSDKFTNSGEQITCPSAYGYSFAGGSTEDGGGHFLFREGMTEQSFILDILIRWLAKAPKWTKDVKDCQRPKAILLETGSAKPPLQSQIRSITVALVGQLAILALPAEVTTMAGRRLRAAVMNELAGLATDVVLAGYSNGYAGYITTPEEYMVQQYEGGHTLHGRWTLPAYQQIASDLASSLKAGTSVEQKTRYDDWRGKSVETPLYAAKNRKLESDIRFGNVYATAEDKRTSYSRGEIVKAQFLSYNPTAFYRTGNNFLRVEQATLAGWKTVATDSGWNTTVRWRREEDAMIATLTWHIPKNIDAGKYRFLHLGYDSQGVEFQGYSRRFEIK
jgi:neutral ceramidase